jgi:hypothetical protein
LSCDRAYDDAVRDLREIIDMSLTAIMFVNRSGARGEIV